MCRALASLCFALAIAGVQADEPTPLVPATGPVMMMASASGGPEAVTLHLRRPVFVPTTVEVSTRVKGGVEKQFHQVLKAMPGEPIHVPLTCTDVSVHDLRGNMIEPRRVAVLLRRETAVLVSFSGPVDPFFLQTTKLGTLIVQMPPQLAGVPAGPIVTPPSGGAVPFIGPGEPLPAPRLGSGEPPLAPTFPTRDD